MPDSFGLPRNTAPRYVEPTAELREAAIGVRGMFNAYVESGFTEAQALDLIETHVMATGDDDA